MLKLSMLEFFARAIPEGFLFILASYIFSKSDFCLRRYLISSIILSVAAYIIRLLPIQFGVHTILIIIVFIVLTVNVNKIDMNEGVKQVLWIFILEFICEAINVYIIEFMFNNNDNYIFSDSVLKVIYGIPSLFIFVMFLLVYYLRSILSQ